MAHNQSSYKNSNSFINPKQKPQHRCCGLFVWFMLGRLPGIDLAEPDSVAVRLRVRSCQLRTASGCSMKNQDIGAMAFSKPFTFVLLTHAGHQSQTGGSGGTKRTEIIGTL